LANPAGSDPKEGNLAHIFGQASVNKGTSFPDGSALYGITLTKAGAAVADFGAGCGLTEDPSPLQVGPVTLKNIHIHDLKLAADQITRTVIGRGPQLMGPAGDVFQLTRLWNKDTYAYVGHTLSDAQVAMAVLKSAIIARFNTNSSTFKSMQHLVTEAKYFFGAVNIPAAIRDWAAGEWSESQTKAWKDSLVKDGSFKCDGDAMSHHNKGVVGLRLEFQAMATMSNIKIDSLENTGKHDAKHCKVAGYKGGDVRGVAVRHNKNFQEGVLKVADASLKAPYGNVMRMSTLQLDSSTGSSRSFRQAPGAMVGGLLADDI